MSSRSLPQHLFIPGRFGRCDWTIPTTWHRKGFRLHKCHMLLSDTVHRTYGCRWVADCTERFLSVESRDRHEQNAHGNGW